jgi:hypothetical protein
MDSREEKIMAEGNVPDPNPPHPAAPVRKWATLLAVLVAVGLIGVVWWNFSNREAPDSNKKRTAVNPPAPVDPRITLEIIAARTNGMSAETTELTFNAAGQPLIKQTIHVSSDEPETRVKVVLPKAGEYLVTAQGNIDIFAAGGAKTKRYPVEAQGPILFEESDTLYYVRQSVPQLQKFTASLVKMPPP